MSSERTIFLNALEIADPTQREAYLGHECGADPNLRRQVDALLTAHSHAGEFLQKPVVASSHPAHAATAVDGTHSGQQLPGERTEAWTADKDELSFLTPSNRPDALGRLSHYDILTVLGKGAFGTVFKAFDTRLDRIVAVKVLAPELAASGGARRRFIREAKSAASVRHEHVVDIHAVDENPIPYLVMECIIGQTLQQKLDKAGSLSVIEILRIGYQIASGLSAAHALGLIHRDIKPANILLENGVERVKITDFGLARAGDDASLTQSGIVCGTPMYMAPEQAQGESLDARADLFSLGSTLYAMCTGRPPFRATTTMAVLKRVVEDEPRPIREINPEMPEWLCDIVDKLLAKSPNDRFPSASEVATLFSQHLAHLQHPSSSPLPRAVEKPAKAAPSSTRSSWDLDRVAFLLAAVATFAIANSVIRYCLGSTVHHWPTDVRLSLMGLFGFIACAMGGLSLLVRRPMARQIVEAVAGASLLIVIGEGLHWFRVGEDQPSLASEVVPSESSSSTATGVPAESGWSDLLTDRAVLTLAATVPGASLKDGKLTLTPTDKHPSVQLSPPSVPFQNGRVKIQAVCVRRAPDFALGLGLNHGSGTPLRVDAVVQTHLPTGPVGFQLWQYDEKFTLTTLAMRESTSIEVGTRIEMEIEVRGGNVRAHVGNQTVEVAGVLSPDRDVIPLLGASGSAWEIVEWKMKTDDKAGPIDSLNWGRFVNPTDLASLERAYDYTLLEVPGSELFNLLPLPGYNLNAPRLVQDVTGDFEISVAIPPFDRPAPGTDQRPGGKVSYRSAGLLLWQDDKTFFRFERSGLGEHEDGAPYLHAEWYGAAANLGDERQDLPASPDGATHLKIQRWGRQLQLFWSLDGLTWTHWKTITNLPLSQQLQIGLCLRNSTKSTFQAKFERLRVRATELPDPSLARIPFDAARSQKWQTDVAQETGIPVELTNSAGVTLRLIPAGEFSMGLALDEINDILKRPHQDGLDKGLLEFVTRSNGPQHKVRVTRPFYIGTTEVTVGQFRQFMKETSFQPADLPANEADRPIWTKPATEETDKLPATRVTWHEAKRFCKWLSEKEGVEYTLPTDAQWEFACRAGSAEAWPHGDDRSELADYAWFGLGYFDPPRPVAQKKPNAFGLYDMLGNAHEWVQDWHQRSFYQESPLIDPVCTQPGVGRVCRGGWWWDSADLIRSASRSYNIPDVRYPGNGFRVVAASRPSVAPVDPSTNR
jgi:serine/threonine protein kinase/formylglycine-generating enzyme required for sulfatase activity